MRPCPTPAMTAACCNVEAATLATNGSPPITRTTISSVPCPLPRRIAWVRVSIASPRVRPSPFDRWVGIRIGTFEACSGFTHVTARWIAQPPKAAFVTRLQPFRLPGRTARQLPDQSTILWVESSSTGDSRLRGARPKRADKTCPRRHRLSPKAGMADPFLNGAAITAFPGFGPVPIPPRLR
jgi:hypothetical protein